MIAPLANRRDAWRIALSKVRWLGALLVVVASSACSITISEGRPSTTPELVIAESASARCVHGVPGPESPYREALPGPVTDPELLPYLSTLDGATRRTAVAAGLEPLIAQTLRARSQSGDSLNAVALRQELAERVTALETQLIATELEVDCVRGLLYDALDVYTESETDRQLDLTIASLAVGSSTTIAAGIWDLANARAERPALEDGPLLLSIAGAVATTVVSAAVVWPKERPILYMHERNVIAPLVFDADPDFTFPTFVFRLLTLPMADGDATPRDQLLSHWNALLHDEIDDDDHARAVAILYGAGGIYDPDLLQVHQRLLQELGAALDLLSRDLDHFNRTLSAALRSTATSTTTLAPLTSSPHNAARSDTAAPHSDDAPSLAE